MPFQHQGMDNGTRPEAEALYTLKEAARQLHVNEEALRQAIDEGIFRGVEEGGDVLLPEEELERAKTLLEQNHQAQAFGEMVTEEKEAAETVENPSAGPAQEAETEPEIKAGEAASGEVRQIVPLYREDERDHASSDWNRKWKAAFDRVTDQFRRLQETRPLSRLRLKERLESFFRLIESKKKKEVDKESENREVSLKLGFMTGQNEMFCDFCEVHDRFYPGAIFADVYVDGSLKWMMCPNCLNYCRQQSNGSMEQNVRARFNHLAHRLEREARRARNLAASENFGVPNPHEWEAWETASVAMQEVAASYPQSAPGYDTGFGEGGPGFEPGFGETDFGSGTQAPDREDESRRRGGENG